MNKKSEFDASASMLGYLYQIRYSLYLSLKRLPEVDDLTQYNISIEMLDDVAIDKEGAATELLQTKLHGKPGNLTNRSEDIWKTIRVWVEAIRNGDVELGKTTFTLVTTQSLPKETIAYYLSDEAGRDTAKALAIMSTISSEANIANAHGYSAFISLSEHQKIALLNSIYIIGQSDNLEEIRDKIYRYGRQYVGLKWVDAFIERLEGVWGKWCIESLSQESSRAINFERLQHFIDSIRPEYTSDNLPSEFSSALPEILDVKNDTRMFVKQLNIFDATDSMIEKAIINYFRAFEQRTKWTLDGLLEPGELKRYDKLLSEKWDEHKSFIEFNNSLNTSPITDKRKISGLLYQKCTMDGIVHIRKNFTGEYVSKGSYHILSDDFKIGWHPDYVTILGCSSNEDAA